MRRLIPLLFVCLPASELQAASNFQVMETEELQLEYAKLNPNNRDPYAPQYTGKWRERVSLLWDSNIVRYRNYRLVWNHNVHTETIDSGAVKTVGWEWWAGISLGRVDILHHHHSRHIMDERVEHTYYGNKQNQFPVEDSIVVRIKFISRGK